MTSSLMGWKEPRRAKVRGKREWEVLGLSRGGLWKKRDRDRDRHRDGQREKRCYFDI